MDQESELERLQDQIREYEDLISLLRQQIRNLVAMQAPREPYTPRIDIDGPYPLPPQG